VDQTYHTKAIPVAPDWITDRRPTVTILYWWLVAWGGYILYRGLLFVFCIGFDGVHRDCSCSSTAVDDRPQSFKDWSAGPQLGHDSRPPA